MRFPHPQGSIVSSIGYGINAVISAIANVLETIIGAIVAVRIIVDTFSASASHLNLPSQVFVAIFDVIFDILCCRCFGSRRTGMRTGRRSYYRRRGFGRGGRTTGTAAGAY
jgi:hypothetical protein